MTGALAPVPPERDDYAWLPDLEAAPPYRPPDERIGVALPWQTGLELLRDLNRPMPDADAPRPIFEHWQRTADPELGALYAAQVERGMRSRDASLSGGLATYGLPKWPPVGTPSLDTWQQTGRQVRREHESGDYPSRESALSVTGDASPNRATRRGRRRLTDAQRSGQRDRYKRAGAEALEAFGHVHLRRDPRAGLYRPRWLDHRPRCRLTYCHGCASIPVPVQDPRRRARIRGTDRLLTRRIPVAAWLLDRAAALRGCREAVGLLDRACGGIMVVPQSCHVRTCPDCESARQARVVDAYTAAVEALPPDRVRFLTLTVRNVGRDELGRALDHLSAAMVKLQHRALWRGGRCRDRARCRMPADPTRRGWKLPHPPVTAALSSIEVTYNAERHSWHPHAHLLIAGEAGIPQAELADTWEALTGDSRIVWIESVRRHADDRFRGDVPAALRELLKYAAKPTPAFLERDAGVLAELLTAIRGRHLTSSSGTLRGVVLDDEAEREPMVLVIPDDPTGEPFRAPATCPLHGGPADWTLHGYLPRRDCRPVAARAGPAKRVLSWRPMEPPPA